MASDRMRGLVNDLENAVWDCGFDAARQKGAVSIRVLSKPVIRRAELLREIAELERKSDLWRSARAANGIEEGE